MSMAFHIRTSEASDIPAIVGLLDALNRFEGYDTVTDAAQLEAALFGEGRAMELAALVAQEGKNVIAALLYYPGYDTLSASYGYHLADMVVAETHRRQGIGRALVKALAEKILAEKKQWLSLTALKRNDAACAFYTSLGMREVDVAFFAIGANAITALVRR